MIFPLFFALEPGVVNLANFFGVELRPGFSMITIEKILQIFQVNEVYECISHVAVVLHVNRQIKKIVFAFELLIYFLNKKFFGKFVWNISYHYSSLVGVLYLFPHNFILFVILDRLRVFLGLFALFFLLFQFLCLLLSLAVHLSLIIRVKLHSVLRLSQGLVVVKLSLVERQNFRVLYLILYHHWILNSFMKTSLLQISLFVESRSVVGFESVKFVIGLWVIFFDQRQSFFEWTGNILLVAIHFPFFSLSFMLNEYQVASEGLRDFLKIVIRCRREFVRRLRIWFFFLRRNQVGVFRLFELVAGSFQLNLREIVVSFGSLVPHRITFSSEVHYYNYI